MKPLQLLVLLIVLMPVPLWAQSELSFVPGFTEPIHDVEIGFSESGRLSHIEVREGDEVNEGTLLLGLDSKIQKLEVRRQELRLTPEAELKHAAKKKQILMQQLKSARNLLDDGLAISREEFEEKELQYSQAEAEFARLKLRKKIEETELELVREQVDRRLLRAPFSGAVASILKGIGESVVPHEPVIRLIDTSTGRFIGNAEVSLARDFSVGDGCCVRVGTPRGIVYLPATVTFISSTVDTASDLMEVRAEFDNKTEKLRLGSPAELVQQEIEPLCAELSPKGAGI